MKIVPDDIFGQFNSAVVFANKRKQIILLKNDDTLFLIEITNFKVTAEIKLENIISAEITQDKIIAIQQSNKIARREQFVIIKFDEIQKSITSKAARNINWWEKSANGKIILAYIREDAGWEKLIIISVETGEILFSTIKFFKLSIKKKTEEKIGCITCCPEDREQEGDKWYDYNRIITFSAETLAVISQSEKRNKKPAGITE